MARTCRVPASPESVLVHDLNAKINMLETANNALEDRLQEARNRERENDRKQIERSFRTLQVLLHDNEGRIISSNVIGINKGDQTNVVVDHIGDICVQTSCVDR